MITIKSKEDIRKLREGGKRHAEILKALSEMVRPGISAKELEEKAYTLIIEKGDTPAFLNYQPRGTTTPFPASLCVSVNDEVVHGIPLDSDKILKEGDIVSLDLGLIHEGMITDAAVTVPVGKVSEEMNSLIKATKEALNKAIKAAKGGKRVGDIGMVIERTAIAHKFGVVTELSGHGVGYNVHEDPYVPNYGEAGEGEVLTPGMVLAIEPIFTTGNGKIIEGKDGHTYKTKDGKPSAHFEHTILITKGEPEIFTI